MVCNYCGNHLRDGARFCPKCGAPVNSDNNFTGNNRVDAPEPQRHDEGNGLRVAIIVVATILVLLVSVILAFMWMNSGDSDDESSRKTKSSERARQTQSVTSRQKKSKLATDEPTEEPTESPEQSPTLIPTPTASMSATTPTHTSSYAAYKGDFTWQEAQQAATNMGGYLVSVNSAEEFSQVCALADSKGIKVMWLGASRASGENWGTIRWADGSYLTYAKWLESEPTYYASNGNEEKYLMAFKVGSEWFFNDSENDVTATYPGKIGYIVETEE